MKPLRLIFLGTPDFAVPSLMKLSDSPHDLVGIVTVPDKQQGRGRHIRSSAVKQYAETLNIPIFQPESLKNPEFLKSMRDLKPDLMIVVAFRILPEALYGIPQYGAFNLHASLLPRYRGAAPIHWALLNGEKETGVSTFFLQRQVDTGNIILQKKLEIQPDDNLQTLHDLLSEIGAEAVLETVNRIAEGKRDAIEQDDSMACPAPKITPELRHLDFNESAEQCHNRVRAFAPRPGAYTHHQEKQLKVLKTEYSNMKGSAGTVIAKDQESFSIACHEGSLRVLSVQPEAGKVMSAAEYMRGHPLNTGDHFG